MGEKASLTMVKAINYNLIWDILLSKKELTIPQIVELSCLSLPTVTRAVNFGMGIDMIRNDNVAASSGGRKAQLYALNKDYAHFLLIFYGKGTLYFEVRNMYSDTISSGHRATAYHNILSDIETIIEQNFKKDNTIKFVAISLNCVVNDGVILDWWAYPQAKGTDIQARLEAKFHIHVLVENNMKVAVRAAQNYAEDYQCKNIASVQFGNNGFGAGLMIQGKVLRGKNGFAGELGYLPLTLKYEYSIQFCSKVVQAIVSMNDPDVIIIYFTKHRHGLEKIKKNVAAHIPPYAVPNIVEGNSFRTDTFFGLQFLCIRQQKKMIETMFA